MTELRPGDLFANRFEIESVAGSGGMGTVYRARDRLSNGLVALKLITANSGDSPENERFVREAQFLSELRHPGIVSYVAHGATANGHRFLVMEWLDGHDLARRLTAGPLQLTQTLRLARRLGEALQVAHRRGIIHRNFGERVSVGELHI